ncbi:MAG: hypothetical protein HYT80_03755 [Euryarchaeota archaeon]|nr:hypothetical protein [Euryarchaeota archaeon]
MADYFGASAIAVEEPITLALPDPGAPKGSAENLLGSYPPPGAGTYLLGLRCPCGHAFLVYAAHFDSDAAVACPRCEADLKGQS